MQLHPQARAALVILDQAHQCPHRGILGWRAELFGRVAQGPVVTGGISTRKQQLRIRAALFDAFLQRIPQRDIQQAVRCLNGSRTSTLGNRLRCEQCFHFEKMYSVGQSVAIGDTPTGISDGATILRRGSPVQAPDL